MPPFAHRLCLALLCAVSSPARGADPDLPDGTQAGERAISTFKVPDGLKISLFAAEPQLASPVAFGLDEQGRVYVAEEFRFNRGTEENRTRPFLLDDDLQIQTVDDRLAMYKKFADKFEGGMDWFTKHADQVRLVEDRDGDGRADHSSIFASFNEPLDGLAAGVLAHEGNIYLTCIPNLWLLRDTDGDGKADVRKVLLHGFGVNAGFLGHDLHGLAWGPDGKLYFSVGDRGFHVKTQEGETLHGPRNGAVFRCNADGSELEVVARGLRNPQEIAFDDYGNLFAADNNCDKGDHSRLVYVLEGADSGWNMAYQTIAAPYLTGPWHNEKMWHLPHAGQPAWLLPPVGKLGAGPSGFAYYSGTGLPERYAGHFFMCNYTGRGGVESFALQTAGAGFQIVDEHDFFKPIQATDVEFGYDGKMYVADFVGLDWAGASRGGRIYTVQDPAQADSPVIRQTRELFAKGFAQRPAEELGGLLAHPDRRVRQRAQFALAEKGAESRPVFEQALAMTQRLPRLHGVWGLGQLGRKDPASLQPLVALLGDSDVEVRSQIIKVLGGARRVDVVPEFITALQDASPRIRLFAAMALAKAASADAIAPVVEMLAENNNADPFLRHAGVMALLGSGDLEAVQARAKDPRAAVRMAVLLVQRRTKDPRVSQFLADADPLLVVEAARAINDVPIEEGTASLAALLDRYGHGAGAVTSGETAVDLDPLLRRAIHANFRLGGAEQAQALVRVVVNPEQTPQIRREALAALGGWAQPGQRDRVNGFWRPLAARDPAVIREVLTASVARILATTDGDLQTLATEIIGKLNIAADDSTFAGWIVETDRPVATRAAALRLLAARKSARLKEGLAAALADKEPRLRAEARQVLAGSDPERALESLTAVLNGPAAHVTELQRAFATLASLQSPDADALLADWATRLVEGKVPAELQLDLLEAAGQRDVPRIKQALDQVVAARSTSDPLAKFRPALLGGDAERGREVFTGHRLAQCIRCHAVRGTGGTAGPDLTQVAGRGDREHLLQSLIVPDAKIAPGFGSVALVLTSGKILAGTLKSEQGGKIVLETPDGKTVTVAAEDVEDRSPPKSAMPPVDRVITLRELRDLVEYLGTLK